MEHLSTWKQWNWQGTPLSMYFNLTKTKKFSGFLQAQFSKGSPFLIHTDSLYSLSPQTCTYYQLCHPSTLVSLVKVASFVHSVILNILFYSETQQLGSVHTSRSVLSSFCLFLKVPSYCQLENQPGKTDGQTYITKVNQSQIQTFVKMKSEEEVRWSEILSPAYVTKSLLEWGRKADQPCSAQVKALQCRQPSLDTSHQTSSLPTSSRVWHCLEHEKIWWLPLVTSGWMRSCCRTSCTGSSKPSST